jgi:hypothetical protein
MNHEASDWLLWSLDPWLPFGWLLILVLIVFLAASFAWTARPSGRSPAERPSAWHRFRPLAILLIPIFLTVSFTQIIFPWAVPETLVLRSQALRPGDARTTVPCLDIVLGGLTQHLANTPLCLKDYLPGVLEPDVWRSKLSNAVDILSPAQVSFKSEGLDDELKKFRDDLALIPEHHTTDRFTGLFELRATWWELTNRSVPIDISPVVNRALENYVNAGVSDLQYREGAPDIVEALKSAVERAVTEIKPLQIQEGNIPDPPRPRERIRVEVIEAIEVAVIRLLAAERNVVAVVVEQHFREDEAFRDNAWRRLQETLLDGNASAHGRPVGLAVFPGSRIASSSFVDVVDKPWLRQLPSGDAILHAHLRFGETLVDWTLSMETGSVVDTGSLPFACQHFGVPEVTTASFLDSTNLSDCLPVPMPDSGEGAVISLLLRQADLGNEIPTLRITPPSSLPVNPVVVASEKLGVPSIGISADGPSATDVQSTLQCLLAPGSSVSTNPSIGSFRSALIDGELAHVVIDPTLPDSAVIRNDSGGLWIRPQGIKWERIKREIIGAGLNRGRVLDLSARLAPGGDLYGTPIFPVAFGTSGLPSGIRPLVATPLAPRRSTPLALGDNPSDNLMLLQTARLFHPSAQPVAFSALPRFHVPSPIDTLSVGIAPMVWRIELAPNASDDDIGGVVWFFDIDPEAQGLLLPGNCLPNWESHEFYCSNPDAAVYEPSWDEARFFPLWLAILRASRVSATEPGPIIDSDHSDGTGVPDFVTPEMLARAEIASASTGILLLSLGLFGHAALLIWLRVRNRIN